MVVGVVACGFLWFVWCLVWLLLVCLALGGCSACGLLGV